MYNNESECLALIDEANSLMQENKITAAKKTFDKVLKLDSNNTLALFGKSLCFYRTGDYNLARMLAKKALNIDPKVVPQDYYEDLLEKTGNKSSSSNSQSILELLKKASILMNSAKIKDAIKVFDSVLNKDLGNVTALYGKSVCYYMDGDFHQALNFAKKSMRIDHNSIPSDYYKDLLSKTKNSSNSSRNNSSRQSNPLNAKEHIAKGVALIKSKQFNEAITYFDNALDLEPKNNNAIIGKAYCYYSSGDKHLAYQMCDSIWRSQLKGNILKYYDTIVRDKGSRRSYRSNNRKNVNSQLSAALNIVNYGDYKNAKTMFEEVLSFESNNKNAIVGKAYCLKKMGLEGLATRTCYNINRYELSNNFQSLYDEIKGLNNNSRSSSRRSNNSRRSGRSNNSSSSGRSNNSRRSGRSNNSRHTNNYSSNKPRNNYSNNNSKSQVNQLCDEGFSHIENYEIKDALKCFKQVLKIDPNNLRAIEGNAHCYYNLGYYVRALKECDKALSIDKNSIDNSFYRNVKNKANNL